MHFVLINSIIIIITGIITLVLAASIQNYMVVEENWILWCYWNKVDTKSVTLVTTQSINRVPNMRDYERIDQWAYCRGSIYYQCTPSIRVQNYLKMLETGPYSICEKPACCCCTRRKNVTQNGKNVVEMEHRLRHMDSEYGCLQLAAMRIDSGDSACYKASIPVCEKNNAMQTYGEAPLSCSSYGERIIIPRG